MIKKIVILLVIAFAFTACGAPKCGYQKSAKKYYKAYGKKVKYANKR